MPSAASSWRFFAAAASAPLCCCCWSSVWSMLIAPSSFSSTMILNGSVGACKMRFSSVVLPAPRKPVRIVTGTTRCRDECSDAAVAVADAAATAARCAVLRWMRRSRRICTKNAIAFASTSDAKSTTALATSSGQYLSSALCCIVALWSKTSRERIVVCCACCWSTGASE